MLGDKLIGISCYGHRVKLTGINPIYEIKHWKQIPIPFVITSNLNKSGAVSIELTNKHWTYAITHKPSASVKHMRHKVAGSKATGTTTLTTLTQTTSMERFDTSYAVIISLQNTHHSTA